MQIAAMPQGVLLGLIIQELAAAHSYKLYMP
jgi:hypothetical protein